MTYRKFLDASLIPLERALVVRAKTLEEVPPTADEFARLGHWLAGEFRKLAAELHEDGR